MIYGCEVFIIRSMCDNMLITDEIAKYRDSQAKHGSLPFSIPGYNYNVEYLVVLEYKVRL